MNSVARFIHDGRAARHFASTDAFLIALDAQFPDLRFVDFVGAYFLADRMKLGGGLQ